ncbi:MAG TPA: RNA polymerase sigma factor [Caulobacteraceae bacterium]|jgi:RNA polymerase sigma-70 factor (ECF subfamily)
MDDRTLAARIDAGDRAAVTFVVRANNQRLFRAAWGVLKNRADAEEAVQEGYMKAFAAIGRFGGASSLATWLTRIVVNEAISKVRASRRRKRSLEGQGLTVLEDYRERLQSAASLTAAPEESVMRRELAQILQGAIARLPETFRLVFVLHEIEGLSADEVAASIGAPVETVRTRLFRARRRLREDLGPELQRTLQSTVAFAGADCDGMTARVLAAFEAGRD